MIDRDLSLEIENACNLHTAEKYKLIISSWQAVIALLTGDFIAKKCYLNWKQKSGEGPM